LKKRTKKLLLTWAAGATGDEAQLRKTVMAALDAAIHALPRFVPILVTKLINCDTLKQTSLLSSSTAL
jgi:hypothetical protein